ncbi:MAG: MotA/TolQ/ExbB proton channel family protein, partial [Duncaniella sp.]|nr:MotA/TolQ/ExbB proton channel family protein [Duncaniella sp.]
MLQQQIADTAGAVAVIAEEAMRPEAVSTVTELSVWDLTMRGGLIMIPLAILSIISIYIFVERYIVIFKAGREDTSFMKRIKEYIHDGEVESARNLCARTDTPYARLIFKGISRIGRPMQDVLVTIENTGNMEI